MFIYVITNLINKKQYVGQTRKARADKRWREHRSLLTNNKHYNPHLQYSWNKYGENAFSFNVIDTTTSAEALNDLEVHYITMLKPEYNLTQGGKNGRMSEESRKKISEGLRGRPVSEETRMKMSAAHKGRRLSVAHRKKLSDAKKNMSDETRKNMSNAQKGKKISEETRKKLSDMRKGRTFSDEHRQALSEVQRGRKFTPQHCKNISEGRKRVKLIREQS